MKALVGLDDTFISSDSSFMFYISLTSLFWKLDGPFSFMRLRRFRPFVVKQYVCCFSVPFYVPNFIFDLTTKRCRISEGAHLSSPRDSGEGAQEHIAPLCGSMWAMQKPPLSKLVSKRLGCKFFSLLWLIHAKNNNLGLLRRVASSRGENLTRNKFSRIQILVGHGV